MGRKWSGVKKTDPRTGLEVTVYAPRIAHLKINCTYACDRRCANCNRVTRIAPSCPSEDLDPAQLARMLEEASHGGPRWTRIVLTGGEPTMHPGFEELVDVMMDYKQRRNPECHMTTFTYHHPEHYCKIERATRKHPLFQVWDTGKQEGRIHRWAPFMAPIDNPKRDPNHFYRGCHMNCRLCGTGYDYKGFYCCPVATNIARIFGMDMAIQHPKDVTLESLTDQFQAVCPKCGLYNYYPAGDSAKDLVSKSWLEAFRRYNATSQRR